MKYAWGSSIAVCSLILSGCLIEPTTQTQVIPGSLSSLPTVSWTANREKAVNSLGGGYRVYYGQTSGFSIATAQFINVPYVSGGVAPTSVAIKNFFPGKYYFKIVAYSTLGTSSASDETSMVIP